MDIYNLKTILPLTQEPTTDHEFNSWAQQDDILPFLEKEIEDDYIILYASLPHVFIHSVLIPYAEYTASEIKDLLQWDECTPYSSWGAVCTTSDVWIEPPLFNGNKKISQKSEQIIFACSFRGVQSRANYYELNQKIAHILGVHFMDEKNAWCKLNQGDLEEVVKIFSDISILIKNSYGTLIVIQKKLLAEYAGLTDMMLVRKFDFTRYKKGDFFKTEGRQEIKFDGKNNIYGELIIIPEYGSHSVGIQLTDIKLSKSEVHKKFWHGSESEAEKQYVEYLAYDFKNTKISTISCNPLLLANYFTESNLPFELTPAFFKPEVLLKYKSDKEKYQLKDRSISCRESWHLETFDINSAGQVHTYLIYLSRLPYEEQLHWKQYNESPKTSISDRALTTDFIGQFDTNYDPLLSLKRKLESLNKLNQKWWKLRNDDALIKVHYPYTDSRDEWAEEILNLDQLLVEGFETSWLRKKAVALGRVPDPSFGSLKLVEECLIALGFEDDNAKHIVEPFQILHKIRTKSKGHSSGKEAEAIRKDLLKEFGTYRKHFESLCKGCDENLELLIEAFEQFV